MFTISAGRHSHFSDVLLRDDSQTNRLCGERSRSAAEASTASRGLLERVVYAVHSPHPHGQSATPKSIKNLGVAKRARVLPLFTRQGLLISVFQAELVFSTETTNICVCRRMEIRLPRQGEVL